MKRILLLSAALTVLILGWFMISDRSGAVRTSSSEEQEEEAGEKKGPGYFEFFKKVKGEAPLNALNAWARSDRFSKKGGSILDELEELGPYNVGGRTRTILVDRSNPNRIFVGAISGGLWVSEQGGRGWEKVNDHEITLNITGITQNPFNPDILYYCTGEGAGNSSAAPGAGVFKSVDHGKTFTQLPATTNGEFNYTWRIVHSLVDSQTVYVGTQNNGLYRSTDGGNSFEKVLTVSTEVHDVEVFEDSSVMATARGIGVYHSPDGSPGSFSLRTNGLPSSGQHGRIEIAYCASQPDRMYAAVSASNNASLLGVYKSADRGMTWLVTGDHPQQAGGKFPFTWYCLAMHVKRDDPNTVFIGSVNSCVTTNGGNSWDEADDTHADYHVIADHPSKSDTIYVGNDGGVYAYTWSNPFKAEDLNWGLNITQFYTGAFAPSGLSVMAGAQDNGTNYTFNGNDTFSKAYGADGSYTQISQQDPSLAYLSFQNGRIFRVDNFGSANQFTTDILNDMDADNNKTVDDGAWFINPFDINPQDGEMVFFPTKKKLYRSNNGGILFDVITNEMNVGTGIEAFCLGVSNQKNPTVYVGGSNSLLYRVKHAAWSKPGEEENLRNTIVPTNLRTSFIGCLRVSPVDPSTVYVGYTNYSALPRIYKITGADGDNPQFVDISGNLPSNLPVNWVEVDPASPDSVLFAATDFGLYFTTDGGATWEKEEGIPNVVVDMIRLRMSDRRLFVFTHGRGAFTARVTPYNKPIPPHDIVGVTVPGARPEYVLYPNPANSYFRLRRTEGNVSREAIRIYDRKGGLVREVTVTGDEPVSTEGLAPGVYFVRSSDGKSRKLVILH